MATCPVCQSAIEISAQHHGTLFTCPKCSAVFFVDWSGQPEVAGDDPSNGYPPNEYPPNEYSSNDVESFEAHSASVAGESLANPGTERSAQSEHSAPMEDAPNFGQNAFANSDFNAGNAAEEFPSEPVAGLGESMADIANFGNAETTSAAFHYTVTISGIDSATVRAALREALADSKFAWDLPGLLAQIKDGSLTIRSVSAIKAGILIQRIKFLPVKVSWRQDVLSGGF